MLVMFAPCQNKACVFLSIKNDNISEGIESFHVRLERTPMLDNRITLSTVEGEIYITDDDGNNFLPSQSLHEIAVFCISCTYITIYNTSNSSNQV